MGLKNIISKWIINSPIRITSVKKEKMGKGLINLLKVNDVRELIHWQVDNNQEFSTYISYLRIGKVWKYTKCYRHSSIDEIIHELMVVRQKPLFIDVGASDGITSANLFKSIGVKFGIFFVTDLFFSLDVAKHRKDTLFFLPGANKCFLICNDRFTYYSGLKSPIFILNWIAKQKFRRVSKLRLKKGNVCLLHPDMKELQKNQKEINILEWDVFTPWKHEKVDMIRIANVLNKVYFPDEKIIESIKIIHDALKDSGYLLIIENRKVEKWSLFIKKGNHFELIENKNSGSEIEDLIVTWGGD